MRICYLDPGLTTNLNHNANICRCIIGELRGRGHDVDVFAHKGLDSTLGRELQAVPYFSFSTYAVSSRDSISGWLETFMLAQTITSNEMLELSKNDRYDLVYLNTASPPQLSAVVKLFNVLISEKGPTRLVVEFGLGAGLKAVIDTTGNKKFTPISNQAVLYRYLANTITKSVKEKIVFFTFDQTISEEYAAILDTKVHTFSFPQTNIQLLQSRAMNNPITVSFLGHQRHEKGFHLVPQVIKKLVANHLNIRVLVHNGDKSGLREVSQEIANITTYEPRVQWINEIADNVLWSKLICQSDLIVLPYHIDTFTSRYSAVASEAIANGIPLVVPDLTTMAKLINNNEDCGVSFKEWTAESVVDAIGRALLDFPNLADRAFRSGQRWQKDKGVGRFVDELFQAAEFK